MMMDSEKDFLSGADRFSVLLDNSDDEYVQIVLTDEYIDANNWMSANFTRILDHLQTTERPLAHIDTQQKTSSPVFERMENLKRSQSTVRLPVTPRLAWTLPV